jgi:hypothetical protein
LSGAIPLRNFLETKQRDRAKILRGFPPAIAPTPPGFATQRAAIRKSERIGKYMEASQGNPMLTLPNCATNVTLPACSVDVGPARVAIIGAPLSGERFEPRTQGTQARGALLCLAVLA